MARRVGQAAGQVADQAADQTAGRITNRAAGQAASPIANPPIDLLANRVVSLAASPAANRVTSVNSANPQDRHLFWRHLFRDVALRGIAFPLLAKVRVNHLERIPADGPTLIIVNHRAGIDPAVMMGGVVPRFVVPMSKTENFNIPVLGWIMHRWGVYAIHREQIDRTALQLTIDLLKSGELILIFPEGTRQPAMIEAKDGLTYVAAKSGAVVVPIGLDGTRDFVPNLKRLRRTPITANVGRPFRFKTHGQQHIPRRELARMTEEAMYQLALLIPAERRGYYSDISKATTDTLEFVGQG